MFRLNAHMPKLAPAGSELEPVGRAVIDPVSGVDSANPGQTTDSAHSARAAGEIPGWLKVRRERLAAARAEAERAAAEPPIVILVSTDMDDRPWPERLRRGMFSRQSAAYVVSLCVHLSALILLSVAIVQSGSGDGGINTLFVSQAKVKEELPGFDAIEAQVGFDGGHTASPVAMVPVQQFVGDLESTTVRDLTSFAMQGQGHGEGEGEKTGDGTEAGGFRMPAPGQTVVKGNFTVWTVPEDPDPGVPYDIVIQVKLPKNAKLRWGDVSGLVVGTDGYEQRISQYSRHTRYIIRANQVVVRVPGARNKVRDHIQVRSNMLHESQTLEIVF